MVLPIPFIPLIPVNHSPEWYVPKKSKGFDDPHVVVMGADPEPEIPIRHFHRESPPPFRHACRPDLGANLFEG